MASELCYSQDHLNKLGLPEYKEIEFFFKYRI
jgi:hypothetical protein